MNRKELIDTMTGIVEKNVRFYKSDFYDYDKVNIEEKYLSDFRAAWIIRDSGTYLIKITNSCYPDTDINAVYDCMTVKKIYLITKRGGDYEIKKSTKDKIIDMIQQQVKYHICLSNVYGTNKKVIIGYFDTFAQCEECAAALRDKLGFAYYSAARAEGM